MEAPAACGECSLVQSAVDSLKTIGFPSRMLCQSRAYQPLIGVCRVCVACSVCCDHATCDFFTSVDDAMTTGGRDAAGTKLPLSSRRETLADVGMIVWCDSSRDEKTTWLRSVQTATSFDFAAAHVAVDHKVVDVVAEG
eukprot:jgi/Ulvmu1/7513/UM037_0057.1